MEGVTVHKLNKDLVVSITRLPGFKKMGSCVIRDSEGKKSGVVDVFYSGDYFEKSHNGDFHEVTKDVMRLAKNFALKTSKGVCSTRFNLTVALRERASRFKQSGSPEAASQASIH